MIAKTLIVWHGSEETDDSRGAAITFSTNELARNGDTYVLKNARGEIVATLKIARDAHAREVG